MIDINQIRDPWDPIQLAPNAGIIFGVQFVATVSINNDELQNKSTEIHQKTTHDCIKCACEFAHLKQIGKIGTAKKKKGKTETFKVETEYGLLMDAKLKITDESVTIFEFEDDKKIAESDICKIQYVSIGDSSTLDFIGYVVSNTPQDVVCHVIQCLEGSAFEVLSTITQGMHSHCAVQLKPSVPNLQNRRFSTPDVNSCRRGCSCCDSTHRSSYWDLLPQSGGNVDEQHHQLEGIAEPDEHGSQVPSPNALPQVNQTTNINEHLHLPLVPDDEASIENIYEETVITRPVPKVDVKEEANNRIPQTDEGGGSDGHSRDEWESGTSSIHSENGCETPVIDIPPPPPHPKPRPRPSLPPRHLTPVPDSSRTEAIKDSDVTSTLQRQLPPVPDSSTTEAIKDSDVTSTIQRQLPPVPDFSTTEANKDSDVTSTLQRQLPHVPDSSTTEAIKDSDVTSTLQSQLPPVPDSSTTDIIEDSDVASTTQRQLPLVPDSSTTDSIEISDVTSTIQKQLPPVPDSSTTDGIEISDVTSTIQRQLPPVPDSSTTDSIEVSDVTSTTQLPPVPDRPRPVCPPPVAPRPTTKSVKEGLTEEQWYVGEMGRLDAESRLKCEGEFMVRLSKGYYVLSVRVDTTWMHNQLCKTDQQNFHFRGRQFISVKECVIFFVDRKEPLRYGPLTVVLVSPYSNPSK